MDITDRSVPPGFRFHPTEEELVGYYLMRKINHLKIDLDVIVDIDLYRMEPWDIQDKCKLGYAEQNEWYFFSHKDKKYPTGTRTNRATAAGFWKATGRDKAVISKNKIIGMRKTLVYYKGRAPNGKKSDWIMHEYRLQTSQHAPTQEEGWVVCRAFKKPTPSTNRPYGYDPCWHMMSRSSSTHLNVAASPSPLPDLIESSYNHPATTSMTAYHHHHQQPLPAAVAFNVDDQVQMGNYNQQGFDQNSDGGFYDEDFKSANNWKFFNSLLDNDEQPPSCSIANDPTTHLDHSNDNNNPGYGQLSTPDQDDQVAHYLSCFTNL